MFGVKPITNPLGAPRRQVGLDDVPVALAWSGQGSHLAVALSNGAVNMIDARAGVVLRAWSAHGQGTLCLGWNPHHALLASGGQDGCLRLWNDLGGSLQLEQSVGRAWVEKLAWHPGGRWCAVACGKVIYWWDVETQRGWKTMDHPATVADLAWSPDGRVLAAASYGGVWLWTPGAVEAEQHLAWKGSSLVLAWSPDGRYLAAGEQDSSVHFWYVREKKECRMWGFPGKVRELAWDPTGRYLATGSGPDICVWDCSDPGPEGREPMLCQITDVRLTALAWARSHALLAAGYADGSLRLWQPPRRSLPVTEAAGPEGVTHVQWSVDGAQLAVARRSGMLELY
jgi:WD40 repeat protein